MFHFPHTRLHLGPTQALVISGPHIQVLDAISGEVLQSTATLEGLDKQDLLTSGPIRCSAVDRSWKYFATVGEDKKLKVWDIGLNVLSSRELPKKPTHMRFSNLHNEIIISDKFGDVFKYPLRPLQTQTTPTQPKHGGLMSHGNPSGGELILGHASLLSTFVLTPDEHFIVTADRDEHIRVSWYPEGYNIESYCLGHERYVSALDIPPFSPYLLVSGGGDPTLKIWDMMTGNLQQEIVVFPAVEPFIKVMPPRKWGVDLDSRQVECRRGIDSHQKTGDALLVVSDQGPSSLITEYAPSHPQMNQNEPVFVIHRIHSFESDGRYLAFSAIGATAIFVCSFPNNAPPPPVHFFDFHKPVLDFCITDDGLMWIQLDAQWGDASTSVPITKMVRIVQWISDKFVEVDELPLLKSLNSHCLIPASKTVLQALDLYSDLSSFPKNPDAELISGGDGEAVDAPGERTDSHSQQDLGKRQLGRLKHKRAWQALIQETSPQEGLSGMPVVSTQSRAKKAKSDLDE